MADFVSAPASNGLKPVRALNEEGTGGEAQKPCPELRYLLRRAEEEAIAAIRSTDERVASCHSQLSALYAGKAFAFFARDDEDAFSDRQRVPGAVPARCKNELA